MSLGTSAIPDDVAAMFSDHLERERQLGRAYRHELQAAWSPRVRRLWDEGWAVKREHEETLLRLLGGIGKMPTEDSTVARSIPPGREILSWVYDQERSLAGGYRDLARLAAEPNTLHVLRRLADEQRRLVERVRETYRDYSAA